MTEGVLRLRLHSCREMTTKQTMRDSPKGKPTAKPMVRSPLLTWLAWVAEGSLVAVKGDDVMVVVI